MPFCDQYLADTSWHLSCYRYLFGLQLALNLAWSVAFFAGRSPAAGVAVILVLWASVVATIMAFGRVQRLAALLLLPYLAWVTFAAVLNVEIWRLNSR